MHYTLPKACTLYDTYSQLSNFPLKKHIVKDKRRDLPEHVWLQLSSNYLRGNICVIYLDISALLWNSRVQKLCGPVRVAKLVEAIHHCQWGYPPLVAQLFGQWHRHARRGPYICCWAGVDRVIRGFVEHNSQCVAVFSSWTERHKHGARGLEVKISLRLQLISHQSPALLTVSGRIGNKKTYWVGVLTISS